MPRLLEHIYGNNIMYSLDSSKPIANEVIKIQADRVKKSLFFLLNECAKKLNLKDVDLFLAGNFLADAEKLSPELHFLHHQLQTAMRNQYSEKSRIFVEKIVDEIRAPVSDKNISISTISNSEWEIFFIKEVIRLTEIDCGNPAEISPISSDQLSKAKDWITMSLCTIARCNPKMFDELIEHVKIIKLFSGKVTMGFTDVRILGVMLLRLPRENVNPVLYFIEHIIHEASHMHLNCIMASDSLILNSSIERFKSPLRSDLRPMLGVLHATYVSAKISKFFLKYYQETKSNEALQILGETLDETIRGTEVLVLHAKLTLLGRLLVDSIEVFIKEALELPDWQDYDFSIPRTHRFGVGMTKVNRLYEILNED